MRDYAQLQVDILRYLSNQIDSSSVPGLVALAEDRIADDIEVNDQEVTVQLDTSQTPTTVPADTLYPRAIYLDVSDNRQRVDYLSPSAYYAKDPNELNLNPDVPRWFTVEGRTLVWTPIPDSTINANYVYVARYSRLQNDADTNWVLENKYGLYLYGALIEAEPYIANDPRMATWVTMYENAADTVNKSARRQRFPRGQKTMVARSVNVR